MKDSKKYWFKRRRYGYGWFPVTKEGWAVVAVYVLVLIAGAWSIKDVPENEFTSEVGVYLLVVILATTAMLRIAMNKGPKPKWRWGKKDSDNPEEDW